VGERCLGALVDSRHGVAGQRDRSFTLAGPVRRLGRLADDLEAAEPRGAVARLGFDVIPDLERLLLPMPGSI
jgi:hypothetical protein